jgi:hypothetical protein
MLVQVMNHFDTGMRSPLQERVQATRKTRSIPETVTRTHNENERTERRDRERPREREIERESENARGEQDDQPKLLSPSLARRSRDCQLELSLHCGRETILKLLGHELRRGSGRVRLAVDVRFRSAVIFYTLQNTEPTTAGDTLTGKEKERANAQAHRQIRRGCQRKGEMRGRNSSKASATTSVPHSPLATWTHVVCERKYDDSVSAW